MTWSRSRLRGFTLVELLVALTVMAVLSLMAWRGIDSMARAQSDTRVFGADVSALQAGLAQWGADLDAMAPSNPINAIDFDGRVLRVTRNAPYDDPPAAGPGQDNGSGLRVVAWGTRDVDGRRQWLRWQSEVLHSRADWTIAWQQAAWWGQNPTEELRRREVPIVAVDDWQVYYFRNNSWTSPLSNATAGADVPVYLAPLPDAVRLVLNVSAGQAISGRLTRDWVRPTLGPGGS